MTTQPNFYNFVIPTHYANLETQDEHMYSLKDKVRMRLVDTLTHNFKDATVEVGIIEVYGDLIELVTSNGTTIQLQFIHEDDEYTIHIEYIEYELNKDTSFKDELKAFIMLELDM